MSSSHPLSSIRRDFCLFSMREDDDCEPLFLLDKHMLTYNTRQDAILFCSFSVPFVYLLCIGFGHVSFVLLGPDVSQFSFTRCC